MRGAASVRLALLAAAVAGLAAVAVPVFVGDLSETATSAIFIAPMIGAVAWTAFILRRFARGMVSGAALILIGLPAYGALVMAVIIASMQFGIG